MRIATITLLLSLTVPALAQTPDTTSAERYFPLEVGKVWEYETINIVFDRAALRPDEQPRATVTDTLVGYRRLTVLNDSTLLTTVDDTPPVLRRYVELRTECFDTDGTPGCDFSEWVRLDTMAATIRAGYLSGEDELWEGFGGGPTICPLDVDFTGFDETIICTTTYGDEVEAYVYGGYDEPLAVEPGVTTTVKRYNYFTGVEVVLEFAAGVGIVFSLAEELGGTKYPLVFARIDGVEYGTPIPVAAEAAPPEGSVLALSVYPNPSHGDATVQFALDAPQQVRLAVYDVLGRRVLSEDLGAQAAGEASHRLDAARLPAGVYVVRLDGDAGARATARIVRH